MISNNTKSTGISSRSHERDFLFDNIRFVLIFMVVFSHMLSPAFKQNAFGEISYEFIHLVIMPGFLFITGYFGKNIEKSRQTAVRTFLLPYLVLQLLSFIIAIFRDDKRWFEFSPFSPRWGLWFLLVMFVYRIMAQDLMQIRFILPLSFVISIASGFFDSIGLKFALARIFGFLPFFILGLYCTPEHIEKIRKLPKILPILALVCSLGFTVFIYLNREYDYSEWLNFSYGMLYLREGYHTYDLTFTQGAIGRIAILFFCLCILFSAIALMPRKKSYLSTIGQNTLPVYALHLFILPYIKDLKLFGSTGWDYLLFSALLTTAIVFLLSSRPVVIAYNWLQSKIQQLVFKPAA